MAVIGKGNSRPLIERYRGFADRHILAVTATGCGAANRGDMSGDGVQSARDPDVEKQAVLAVAGGFIPDSGDGFAGDDSLLTTLDPGYHRHF